MQSIPILCNQKQFHKTQPLRMLRVNQTLFLLRLQCSPLFPSFPLDLFPWHLTESRP